MANNLHISYDLRDPGQNYDKVIERIKQLGSWAKIHYSFWYVNSASTASQAVDFLTPVLDANDRVYVVDAVRRQNIWHRSRHRLAERGPRLGLGFMRRACGVASADVRWSVV